MIAIIGIVREKIYYGKKLPLFLNKLLMKYMRYFLGDLFASYAPQVHPCRLVAAIHGGKNPLAKNPLEIPLLH
jgi:hypothetical protein